jgi:hypothetical protein
MITTTPRSNRWILVNERNLTQPERYAPDRVSQGVAWPQNASFLVEDEEDIAEILALVLQSEGYIVDTAGTLAQARQRLKSLVHAGEHGSSPTRRRRARNR